MSASVTSHASSFYLSVRKTAPRARSARGIPSPTADAVSPANAASIENAASKNTPYCRFAALLAFRTPQSQNTSARAVLTSMFSRQRTATRPAACRGQRCPVSNAPRRKRPPFPSSPPQKNCIRRQPARHPPFEPLAHPRHFRPMPPECITDKRLPRRDTPRRREASVEKKRKRPAPRPPRRQRRQFYNLADHHPRLAPANACPPAVIFVPLPSR
jgi:hypothetical protein